MTEALDMGVCPPKLITAVRLAFSFWKPNIKISPSAGRFRVSVPMLLIIVTEYTAVPKGHMYISMFVTISDNFYICHNFMGVQI